MMYCDVGQYTGVNKPMLEYHTKISSFNDTVSFIEVTLNNASDCQSNGLLTVTKPNRNTNPILLAQ